MARRHVGIADRLEQRGREPWNISTRVNMKRARPRNVSRTLYNYTGRGLPSRATPDTPPLAAAMLQLYYSSSATLDGAIVP